MSAARRLPPVTRRQLRTELRRLRKRDAFHDQTIARRDQTIADLETTVRMLKRELANRDEQVAVVGQLAVRMEARANKADADYTALMRTVQAAADAEVNRITQRAPMERRAPSGDVTTETDMRTLAAAQDADEPVARPYAPQPVKRVPSWAPPEPIRWGAALRGDHSPTHVPALAATQRLPAVPDHADTTALPKIAEEASA